MQNDIKYVHTNLITRDWKKLAQFYIEVFGCKPLYPERNLSGEWLEKLTQISQATLKGIHLTLPGYENGPTLEIFEYTPEQLGNNEQKALNRLGFGHIAFHVNSVETVLKKLVEHGGKNVGDVVRKEYPELGKILTVAYAKDPDDNFIELQNWDNTD